MKELEVVAPENQSLQVVPAQKALSVPTIADMEAAFAAAVRQRELLSDYIKSKLQPGKHFYKREGEKPSLTKEGAEIILLPHGLCPDYQILSGPEAPPQDEKQPYQITVKCILRKKGFTDAFEGSAIGSAGSHKWSKKWGYQPRQRDKYLCHNATLKMAEKSAMIAATLNSTAASEFFTQDMEADPGEDDSAQTELPLKPKPQPTFEQKATQATRDHFIKMAEKQFTRDKINTYLITVAGVLLPNEDVKDLPLPLIPTTGEEIRKVLAAMKDAQPYPLEPAAWGAPQKEPPKHPEAFWDVICPIPRKGMKRDEYLKQPDTIGSMYDKAHGEGDQDMAKRLSGFANHYTPEARTVGGKTYQPSSADYAFRKALDEFLEWHEKHKDDTAPDPDPDDDVPF